MPGDSHGWRSLVGYSPQGRKESDTTEQLHFTSGTAFIKHLLHTHTLIVSKNSNYQENQDQKKKKILLSKHVRPAALRPQEAVTVLYIQTPLDPIHRRRMGEGEK